MVEKKCYICGLSRHFFKDCPQKKWETQTFAGFEYEISTTTETKHEQEQSRNRTEFFPGSIHAEEVRGFWREELKAGEWVMDVLLNGYVIPFAKIPPIYEEQNNASATQDMSSSHKQ